jgi:UDP-N-acetylmuramoyl-L-alanyl-D-glutamate--2,6-diaminopimelate ligase
MHLAELLSVLPNSGPSLPAAVKSAVVTGLTEDSRKVLPGYVFIARSGTKTDGAQFLADAAAKGAIAAIVQTPVAGVTLPQIVHPEPSLAASVLANAFFGQPSRQMPVFGVTGTNGKTTVAYIVRHLLNHLSRKTGLIGTVEIDDGARRYESDMTTPSAIEVARLLGTMQANGCAAAAMEASSHALHQNRVGAVRFAAAAFTNLTGDHLDYHGTMEEYAASKARLFEQLDAKAVAVVSDYSPWTARMVRDCKARVVRFGYDTTLHYSATDVSVTASGTDFAFHTPRGTARVHMPLIGKHNIENALAAMGMVGEVFSLSAGQLAEAIRGCTGAPGRLQPVQVHSVMGGQGFATLVDYAHTDDALENVLTALRPLTSGKLRVIFGCGGDRDRTKRPRMAKVAARLADVVYVTSDNPRTENPQAILDEVVTGFTAGDKPKLACVEVDRRSAIQKAVADCSTGDVLLIAGKGHENYQILGTTKHHFDDVEEAAAAIRARLGKSSAAVAA